MLVGELDEVNPLVPEELGENVEGFIDVGASQGERRRAVLRPRPVRQLRPDDAVALTVDTLAARVQVDDADPIDNGAPVPRRGHLIEFEAGEGAF